LGIFIGRAIAKNFIEAAIEVKKIKFVYTKRFFTSRQEVSQSNPLT
jgi:hypothetical protein